jgi:hypothetical protein
MSRYYIIHVLHCQEVYSCFLKLFSNVLVTELARPWVNRGKGLDAVMELIDQSGRIGLHSFARSAMFGVLISYP